MKRHLLFFCLLIFAFFVSAQVLAQDASQELVQNPAQDAPQELVQNPAQDSPQDLKSINNPTFEDLANYIVDNTSIYFASTAGKPVDQIKAAFPRLSKIKDDKVLTYQDASFVIMQTLKVRGGIFYTIFKTRHYAFKELQALEMISAKIDPHKKIPGSEALRILNECIKFTEGTK